MRKSGARRTIDEIHLSPARASRSDPGRFMVRLVPKKGLTMKPDMILYLNEMRGIYIPQNFAEETLRENVINVKDEDWEILEAGPDHEFYWEAWDDVCRDAVITDPDTNVQYTIWQDGDCWLIPVGMEWDDKTQTYRWPSED